MQTEWQYGAAIEIQTAQAGDILWAELVRGGVTTHAFDNSQRLIDLPISNQGAGAITIKAPPHPQIAPPGWYMLFVVDQNRLPSLGSWLHLT